MTALETTKNGTRLRVVKGRRLTHVAQRDERDCGAACLVTVAAAHGVRLSLARVRDLARVGADGTTLRSLARAAEALGFQTRGLRLDPSALRSLRLPAIVHWEGNHFMVVGEVTRRGVLVSDPAATGRRRMSLAEFAEGWTGTALELVPTGNLAASEAPNRSGWRRFLPLLKPFRLILCEVLVASAVLSLLGLGLPYCTQIVVDRVLLHRSVDLLGMLLIGLLAIGVMQGVTQIVRQIMLVHVSSQLDSRIMGEFFHQVFRLPLKFFDKRRVGDVVSRMSEGQTIRRALAGMLPSAALDTLLAIGYLAVLAQYDLHMTGIVLLTVLALCVLTIVFTPSMRRVEKEQFERHTETSTQMIEAGTGIAALKSMAVEAPIRWRLDTLFTRYLLVARRGTMLGATHESIAGILHTSSSVVFLWYGATRVLEGQLTAGEMIAFIAIASQVMIPIVNLVRTWDELQDVRNAVERLGDILDAEPEEADTKSRLWIDRVQGEITLDQVSFGYGPSESDHVLHDVSLKIRAGETVAIVGESGCGKSTLQRLMLGLYEPTKGAVRVDGHDLRHVSLASLRSRVGVVPQDVVLFSGTIRENIALSDPDAPFARIVEAAKFAGIHETITAMDQGYETQVGERGLKLSGGQRQRIAMACAILRDPAILLLDEPTAALDSRNARGLNERLDAAFRDRTVVINSHQLDTIRSADRILVMDAGRIVEQGTHEELLRRGSRYQEFVNATSGGVER